jgi:hypothetical protein
MVHPSAPVSNRRVSRRTGLRRPCELSLPGQVTRKAITSDIGIDGLSFVCANPIAPGTRCRISFELPLADRTVAVNGVVKTVYSSFCGAEGFKIGAVFTALDDGTSAALREFSGPDR